MVVRKSLLCYLAGPVDAALPEEARGWREKTATLLWVAGIATFSPAHAFKAGPDVDPFLSPKIKEINDAAIFNSDVVLVNLPLGAFSIGTAREIEIARQADVPVVVAKPGTITHYLFDCYTFESLEHALDFVASRDWQTFTTQQYHGQRVYGEAWGRE